MLGRSKGDREMIEDYGQIFESQKQHIFNSSYVSDRNTMSNMDAFDFDGTEFEKINQNDVSLQDAERLGSLKIPGPSEMPDHGNVSQIRSSLAQHS